jgi:nitroimidazol reductase NimA-like FMN-containing flavoprotein (pyridoxamine 5'-phosphate oxidase superfamily)
MERANPEPDYLPTERTTLRRRAQRGRYDRATVHAILDEAVYCHVSCQSPERAFCTPMVFSRRDEEILLHGSSANRTLRTLRDGAPACVNVTLLDGLVLGRSAFGTSVNYRSVTLFGQAEEIADPDEKLAALRAIIEGVVPQRWSEIRVPSERELSMTLVLRLPLREVSAKVRSEPPADLPEDAGVEAWAGVIPVRSTYDAPVGAPFQAEGAEAPGYTHAYRRPAGAGPRR